MDNIKEAVIAKVLNDDNFVYCLLDALYEQQEGDEKRARASLHKNYKGFRGGDAELFSDFARYLRKHGSLTEKQLAVLRKRTAWGIPRIAHYWRQAEHFLPCWEATAQKEVGGSGAEGEAA